ncbi:MAG: GGDEF domain-containing protein [Candidatus Magasanikbacteria bacterium]|nr:GGDEF domain-containing protein [Candidatus Magasanikbacteria bacterium]
MPRETGPSPERPTETINPIIKQYLTDHPDLGGREQDFLINYYHNLKSEMVARSATVFRSEATRVKEQAGSHEAFKKAWGTRSQDPEKGANATKLFMGEVQDIQDTAAKQTIELFEMRRTAEIDHITGLYRGEAFDRYAEETLHANQAILQEANRGKPEGERLVSAYVAFDIDDFKTINETIKGGHRAADDEILTPMGEIIRGTPGNPGIIRSTDLASRIGGDEFVILFTQIRADAVQATVDRLLKSFQKITYTTTEGEKKSVSVSAGVKIIEDNESITLKKARHFADEAANLAKIEKNTFLIYTPDLETKIDKMITADIDKPDNENRGLQFCLRHLRQSNKRKLENIAQANPDDLLAYEALLEAQAKIDLHTKVKQLQAKEKSA